MDEFSGEDTNDTTAAEDAAKQFPLDEAEEAASSQPAAPVSSGLSALAQDPELVGDFILESREHLNSIESQMLTLEQDPGNAEAINAVFRSFHTIKGLAGFMELGAIQEVAHEVETVLDEARNGRLRIVPVVADVVLQSADYLNQAIRVIETGLNSGKPGQIADNSELLARVHEIPSLVAAEGEAAVLEETAPEPEEAAAPEVPVETPAAPAAQPVPAAAAPPPPAAPKKPKPEAKTETRAATSTTSEARSVKVDTLKLDYLVEMVGEMVIAQAQLQHSPDLSAERNPTLMRNLAQLGRATSEVQRTALAMRMVPIALLFQKMARLTRDLSRKAGKQVELVTIGEETELDRNIVEELADPLMHMVRNSIDHGLEDRETRLKTGKAPTGKLTLSARHEAGHIAIEIGDDGRGLDRQKIFRKAVEKGLVDPHSNLSDDEIYNLIFLPGFSTAEQVTDISGRGVGMDVVTKHIQKLRGRIEIQSTPGQGSTFILRLPLTLAIIDGLVVGVGEERYIVPIFSVREMLRPTEEMISTVQGRDEMALVRGRLLPVVRLHRKFGVKARSENPWEALLIVSEHEGKPFCLMVDDLVGKQEVVIKSLGETFKDVPGIAGGAILSDGRVGLILDIEGIFGLRSQ